MQNKLLNDEISKQVKEVFEKIEQPVQILYFGKKDNCDYCDETLQLVQEVSELSDKLGVSIYDLNADSAIAKQYKVDKAPTLVLVGQDGKQFLDFGVRFSGIPSGHEFSSLIQSLILVSERDSALTQQTRDFLAKLPTPVLLQVFVTPTCPYCPRAVVLAHQMAMESSLVEAEMVEAMEFPDLAERFGVSGVPQTTINAGAGVVIGAVPEEHLVAEIQRALENV